MPRRLAVTAALTALLLAPMAGAETAARSRPGPPVEERPAGGLYRLNLGYTGPQSMVGCP